MVPLSHFGFFQKVIDCAARLVFTYIANVNNFINIAKIKVIDLDGAARLQLFVIWRTIGNNVVATIIIIIDFFLGTKRILAPKKE